MDDITTSITTFQHCGEINTRKLLSSRSRLQRDNCLARVRCAELGLSKAVIASETGRSALEAVRVFEGTGTRLIVVTHYPATTWGPKGDIPIGLKRKEYAGRLEELRSSGAVVVQGTRPFAPPTRSIGWDNPTPEAVVDKTLEVLGAGFKIAVEEAVSQAIVACWASLWTARAIAYRAQRGIAHDDVAMAVVVQRMVDAEASGVLFTANPVTGDPGEMAIDAAPGLGEGVVGGTVTPEGIVIRMVCIRDRHAGKVVRHGDVSRHVFTDAQVAGLVRLGEQIEAQCGHPQDIEWAWADGRLYALQARPITTAIRPRLSWEPPERGVRYVRGGVMELLPDPISVLFEMVGLPAFERATKEYQERLGLGPAMQGWGFTTINGYVYGALRLNLGMVWEAMWALPVLLGHASQVTPTPQSWREETLPAYRQAVAVQQGDPGALSAQALLERIEALALACGRYWAVFAALVPQLDRAESRFERLYRRLRKKGDPEPVTLLRGLENRPLEGTGNATERIHDGQAITVDGTAGKVYLG